MSIENPTVDDLALSSARRMAQPTKDTLRDTLAAAADTIIAERRRADAAEAKVDALMLEYCPDEMTAAQWDRWASHQMVVDMLPFEMDFVIAPPSPEWHTWAAFGFVLAYIALGLTVFVGGVSGWLP